MERLAPGPLQGGLLSSTAGIMRFLLVRASPHVALYASPVNFDPLSPVFPISHPEAYVSELARELGSFYTAPTLLSALGVPAHDSMEGASLLVS